MTKPKKFRVGQVVYFKFYREYVRLVARCRRAGWWAKGYDLKFTVLESEIRPLTKRESAK